MLFSSGDSPHSASSNLSGEGFDEAQPGESPFFVSTAIPPCLVLLRNRIKRHKLNPRHGCAHPGLRRGVVLPLGDHPGFYNVRYPCDPGKCRYISMKKLFAIVAVFLAVGAGATTHHVYKKHLRSGHAPLIKAIPPSSPHEQTAVNIHDVRGPVRTGKGQQSETRLEPTVAACPDPHVPARQDTFAWKSSNNQAMEEVLHQRQTEAFDAQAGCQAYN